MLSGILFHCKNNMSRTHVKIIMIHAIKNTIIRRYLFLAKNINSFLPVLVFFSVDEIISVHY